MNDTVTICSLNEKIEAFMRWMSHASAGVHWRSVLMRESTGEVDWRHERLRCQLPRHLGPDEFLRFPLWPSVVSLFSPRCRCRCRFVLLF